MLEKYKARILTTQKALGTLSLGMQVDFLMDNFPELQSVSEARSIVWTLNHLGSMYSEVPE